MAACVCWMKYNPEDMQQVKDGRAQALAEEFEKQYEEDTVESAFRIISFIASQNDMQVGGWVAG